MPQYPAPPKPPAPRAPAPPKTAAPQPEPEIPTPRITQLFTTDQRNELTRSYREFFSMVARALDALSKKRLSADQISQVEQIRTFKDQAEDLFKRDDLATAVELAHRASVLAQDLVSRVR
jgi:hypothetical protein